MLPLTEDIVEKVVIKIENILKKQDIKQSQVYFKRNRRDSWKTQEAIDKLSYQILHRYEQAQVTHFPFEFRTFTTINTAQMQGNNQQNDLQLTKKYLTMDYYGCIQMEDQLLVEKYKIITLSVDKSRLAEILDILGLTDIIL